ncbi:MAG: iron dependent repressor, metal binding and dimerization domain protein, partial [Oscillospiraceae bacterium]
HNTLTRCLVALGVCEQTAKEDACRIEHFLSEESFLKIKEHCKF